MSGTACGIEWSTPGQNVLCSELFKKKFLLEMALPWRSRALMGLGNVRKCDRVDEKFYSIVQKECSLISNWTNWIINPPFASVRIGPSNQLKNAFDETGNCFVLRSLSTKVIGKYIRS